MQSDLFSFRGRIPSAAPALIVVLASAILAGCSGRGTLFSASSARAHVDRLAGEIGCRPTGTDANRRARDYIVGQLRSDGYDVRVQEADAQRPNEGLTARVANVIAVKPGAREEAIALMAHYDSPPEGPGAADDAAGVALCLEAARVLALRHASAPSGRAPWSLVIVITDGEELGLMGAAAVLKDPIAKTIRAVLNFEAIGSGGPVMLFQAGPGSGALVEAWADHAPSPAGASFMDAVYRVISRDHDRTDLGLFRRAGIAGLDFAFVGDSYTYHTPLDAPARLDEAALARAGENTVATVLAMEARGLASANPPVRSTYFDVLGRAAVSYGGWGEAVVLALAGLVGLVGWLRAAATARREVGSTTLVLTIPWAIVGAAVVIGAMVGGAWLLRATRESLHPWYAHPDRFFAWLVLAGAVAGRLFVRAGGLLSSRARGSARPATTWTMTLPVWAALMVAAWWFVPGAAFLFAWPLLAAGLVLLLLPIGRSVAMRAASAAVVLVSGAFWLPRVQTLLRFAVAELDRTPLVTPTYFYPALLAAAGIVIAPPWLALLGRNRAPDAPRPGWVGELVTLGLAAVMFAACWMAPAYTAQHPRHHAIRYVADLATGAATWETGGNEPAPPGEVWRAGPSPSPVTRLLGPMTQPFVHYAPAPPAAAAPFRVTAVLSEGVDAAVEITAVPANPGWTILFALPAGATPLETSLPTSLRRGRPVAIFSAVPPEGVTFRARFPLGDAGALSSVAVMAIGGGVPGAVFPHVPTWLPQDADVWQARSYYVLPVEWTRR